MTRFLLCAVFISIVGCQSIDPYTGEQKASNTAKGAGWGALAGAIIGSQTSSDSKEGAIKGALGGAAIGGGIGYYMDRQEAALRQQLAGTGVQVVREGDNIRLVMPGNITFDSGQSSIRAPFFPALDSVATVLAEFDNTAIKIAGHTDSTGGLELNQRLSEDRAGSVGFYLANRQVARGRIQTVGYGSRYPIAGNETSSGRQQNRRVELELLPLDR